MNTKIGIIESMGNTARVPLIVIYIGYDIFGIQFAIGQRTQNQIDMRKGTKLFNMGPTNRP